MDSLPEILNVFFQRCQEMIFPASFKFKWDKEKIVKGYEKVGLFKSILKHSNVNNKQVCGAFAFFLRRCKQTGASSYLEPTMALAILA